MPEYSEKKVAYQFDPFELVGKDIPKGKKREALAEIADYVKTEVLQYVGDARSPVAGGQYKATLSKAYAKEKGSSKANLELTGDMLDSLECVNVGGKLELRIKGAEAPKAYGHNTGFEGHPTLEGGPKRQFIPNEENGETFRKSILKGIAGIIDSYEEEKK